MISIVQVAYCNRVLRRAARLTGWIAVEQAVVDAWAPAFAGGPSQPRAVRGAAVALLGNLAMLTHPEGAAAAGVSGAQLHKIWP